MTQSRAEPGSMKAVPKRAARAGLVASLRVRFDESGPSGAIRPSSYLRYAAELAWRHSEERGYGRDWYGEHGLAWVVRAIELDIHVPVEHGDTVEGSTEVVGFRKVLARRRSEFHLPDGRLAATMTIDWALTTKDGQPTRVPSFFSQAFALESSAFRPIRVRLVPPAGARGSTFGVRSQELDPMGHVNNAVYLDWVDDAVAAASKDQETAVGRRYRLEYLAAAAPDQRILVRTWRDGGSWACRVADAASDEPILGALVD